LVDKYFKGNYSHIKEYKMKRLPKSSSNGSFRLSWTQINYVTGRDSSHAILLDTREMAIEALELAKTQRTKNYVSLVELKKCPDSLETQQEKFRENGANWSETAGEYFYSANY
jgi:hypothetical protein